MHAIRLLIAALICAIIADTLGFSFDWKLIAMMAVCLVAGGICAELSAHEIEAASKHGDLFIGED